jgi:hypothetical protein
MSIIQKALEDSSYREMRSIILETFAKNMNIHPSELEKLMQQQEMMFLEGEKTNVAENTGNLIINEGDKIIKG